MVSVWLFRDRRPENSIQQGYLEVAPDILATVMSVTVPRNMNEQVHSDSDLKATLAPTRARR
jgi:hypothetical protein